MLMKMKTTPAQSVMTIYTDAGFRTVRLAADVPCPYCGRILHASDIEVAFGDVRLICQGCHRDVFTIEMAS